MSLMFGADAFLDAPVLSEFLSADIDTKLYAFVAKDTQSTVSYSTDIVKLSDLLNLKGIVEDVVNLTRYIAHRYDVILSNTSALVLDDIQTSGQKIVAQIETLIHQISSFNLNDIKEVIHNISDIWHEGWKSLQKHADIFVDSVQENTRVIKYNISKLVQDEIKEVKNRFHQVLKNMTDTMVSTIKDFDGVGVRFKGHIDFLGLRFVGWEIEFVKSIDRLGSCSRFQKAYELLQGEEAVRGLAVLTDVGLTGIRFCNVLRLKDAGFGLGFAISLEHKKNFAAQLHAQASLLGVRTDVDVFITPRGLYFFTQLSVWNVYKAQLDVSATLGKRWDELTFDVKGQFVADADGDGSFDDGYLAALRKYTKHLADEATKRLSGVQDDLTKAQSGLTHAQNWLEEKKADIQSANSAFDDAVHGLDVAKDKLEQAKGPFQNAMDKLKEAQRKVDNLCRIRDCKKICVPGIKCRICHKKKWHISIPYPCCRFTSCMLSFPDPICVAANLLCRGVRAVAYAALEAAKVFVRIPMLALDVAKAAVSAAQFVVDKSRVVLDIATAALDIAKLGLEQAKQLVEVAKIAVEAVKQVIKLAVTALNFVLKYGLEAVVDVRNCGFEVMISGADKSVFDVHCDVNIFKLGFKTIRLRVNFSDVVQSLWFAAKSTVELALDSVGSIFGGRKRRDLQNEVVYLLHRSMREANIGDNVSMAFDYESINIVAETIGYQNNSNGDDYSSRTELFRKHCEDFNSVYNFLRDSIDTIFEMSNETMSVLENATTYPDLYDNSSLNDMVSNLTLEEIGIDATVAENEFNITMDELNSTIETSKLNMSTDAYFSDTAAYSNAAFAMLNDQIKDAHKVNLIPHWISAMENVTTEYYNESVACVSFLDCAHYSVSQLYEIFILSNDKVSSSAMDYISDFEDLFLKLTNDFSMSMPEVHNKVKQLQYLLDSLNKLNIFCSTPPVLNSPLQDQVLDQGQDLTLVCNVTGDPRVTFQWFKDGEMLVNETVMELSIKNASLTDSGAYHCVAGNLVANLTVPPAYINVFGKYKLYMYLE